MRSRTVRTALVVLLYTLLPACGRVRQLSEISQVSYSSWAGTILPELQWYEKIVITPDQVTLHRNGMTPDTQINEGDWVWSPDAEDVLAFFRELEAIDCSTIRRIEREPEEGGGTEIYTIVYAAVQEFQFIEGDETSHSNSWLLWKPIQEYVRQMDMPEGARPRYK